MTDEQILELWAGNYPVREDILAFARALLSSQDDALNARRYCTLFGCGVPFVFMGEEFNDKASADAAIDAAIAKLQDAQSGKEKRDGAND